MFVGKNLIYLQLQKTGCTHIARMLSESIDGEQVGKHNRLPETRVTQYVAGSIRNPWDWYVSLWAFGCGGRGSIFHKTTRRQSVADSLRRLNKEALRRKRLPTRRLLTQIRDETTKPVDRWRDAYSDSSDPVRFRTWLKMILDPARRADHDEHGYARSSVGAVAGLLSFRYLRLYSSDLSAVTSPDRFDSVESIKDFDQQTNVLDGIIRTESLEEDLLAVLAAADYRLTRTQRDHILAGKSEKANTSKRRDVSYYYDDASIELVRNKERMLIEKYGYSFSSV